MRTCGAGAERRAALSCNGEACEAKRARGSAHIIVLERERARGRLVGRDDAPFLHPQSQSAICSGILDLLLYFVSDTMATKVVVRRLPAQLGEADFWAKICEDAGQPVSFSLLYYVAGKISRRRGPIPSRGYLSFGSSEVRRARRRARAAS